MRQRPIITTMRGAALGLLGQAAVSGGAVACSCLNFDTVEEHIVRTEVIFEGVVLSSDLGENSHGRTIFKTRKVWKGDITGSKVTVKHPTGGANCGVFLEKGEEVLILANRYEDEIRTNFCTLDGAHYPPGRGNREEYLEALPRILGSE